MKTVGKYIGSLFDKSGDLHITFKVPRYNARGLDLSEDKDYRLDINLVKQKRSIEQNALLWKLLNTLELVTREESWDWYCKALEETNVHFDYLLGLPEIEEMLRKQFRAVKVMGKRIVVDEQGNEKELIAYKIFEGSSKYTVKEMNELIDTVLRYCAEHDIDVEQLKYE